MKKDYTVYTILLLIFYFPIGIPFMWIIKTFSVKTRTKITLAFLFAIILGLLSLILWTSSPGYIH